MIEGKLELIGPTEANEYLMKNAFNRPIKRQHIISLARQMTMKLWRVTGEPIIFDEHGNLQDGQHRLRAIIHSQTTQEFFVIRGTKEEAFVVTDTGKKRSFHDALYIAGFTQPAMYGSLASKMIQWERMIFFGGRNSALFPTNEEVVNYCKEHSKEVSSSINFYQQVQNRVRRLIPGGTFIFCYHICKLKNEAQAFDFFERVLSGNTQGHTKYQPITTLRERLIINKTSVAKLPYKIIVLMILGAWNAYRKNKKLNKLDNLFDLKNAEGKKIEIY